MKILQILTPSHVDSPALIRTRRMYFSPKKFLISTILPPSWITTLIGKWAYTERILYLNPCSQERNKNPLSQDMKIKMFKNDPLLWIIQTLLIYLKHHIWNEVNLTNVTPLIMFWTWLQMVRTVASSFLFPHHLSTRSWEKQKTMTNVNSCWYYVKEYWQNHSSHLLCLMEINDSLNQNYLSEFLNF